MRSPSARVLKDTATVYAATSTQDRGGGYQPRYSDSPTSVLACAAHPHGFVATAIDGRITQAREWTLTFGAAPGIRPRDKVVVSLADGVHVLYAEANKDLAGRGAAWFVSCTEKV